MKIEDLTGEQAAAALTECMQRLMNSMGQYEATSPVDPTRAMLLPEIAAYGIAAQTLMMFESHRDF